jgi:hypothetical protein
LNARYNLTHGRSRQLHDLTLLEIRRQVIGERRLKPIRVVDIRHLKVAALERYAPLLSGEQFTRLCVLLKDLAPAQVYLVKPENVAKIRRGKVGQTLENLELILDGDPSARPLFETAAVV